MLIKIQLKAIIPEYISPENILVNRGSFLMGNTRKDSEGRDDENPVHTVSLTYNYWIGKYEVMFYEYDVFCEATRKTRPDDKEMGRGTRPVINVSWEDAVKYCNWLSEKEGLAKAYDSKGNLLDRNGNTTKDITQVEGYRLPTEAEWEYAARGGHADITDGIEAHDYAYAGSNIIDDVAWYQGNSDKQTHPVEEKKGNELGLYDMSGNVYEWCHDWYESGYSINASLTNLTGPNSGASRVVRGGNWGNTAQNCRVVNRGSVTPGDSGPGLGFRLARTVAPFMERGPIEFVCPRLEEAIRRSDGYTGSKTGTIYPDDVTGIINLFSFKGKEEGITSLEGIQYLTNLQKLYFWASQVSDLTPLQTLTNLQRLSFRNSQVSDLTPLQNLTNLQELSFGGNQVSDLTPLQNLTNLVHLDFYDNQVSNLTPLQNLTNLQELYFGINQVSDITPLQNLTNLTSLYFQNNQVSDIVPLVNNAGIGTDDSLEMRYNNLDLTPGSKDMENINTLISRGCTVYYYPQN
jgi:formylglycine-generating enzyme required for sulfatase activity